MVPPLKHLVNIECVVFKERFFEVLKKPFKDLFSLRQVWYGEKNSRSENVDKINGANCSEF